MTTSAAAPVPNHHAHYPGFAGLSGLLAALSMSFGRGRMARFAADRVAVSSADTLVDVGCGPGAAAREAARRGAAVTGIDPAPVMLTVARLVPSRARPRWVVGEAEELDLPDQSQTIVWALATVHHWADVGAGLAECFRVLRPGGQLLAVERRVAPGASGLASHGWTEPQGSAFVDLCRVAGFVDRRVTSEPAGSETVIAVQARRP